MKPPAKASAPIVTSSEVTLKEGEVKEFREITLPGSTVIVESGSVAVGHRIVAARFSIARPEVPARSDIPGEPAHEDFAPSRLTSPAASFQVSPSPPDSATSRQAPADAGISAEPTLAQHPIISPSLARAEVPGSVVASPKIAPQPDNTIRILLLAADDPLRIVAPSLKAFRATLSGEILPIDGKALGVAPDKISRIAVSVRDTLEKIVTLDPASLPLDQFAGLIIKRHTGQTLTPDSLGQKIAILSIQAVIGGEEDFPAEFETKRQAAVLSLKTKFPNFENVFLSRAVQARDDRGSVR